MMFPLNHGVLAAAAGWSPEAIAGKIVAWWDPSDTSTLFSNSDGSAPAQGDGDFIKRINDKSGNGFDLVFTRGVATLRISGGKYWVKVDQDAVTGSIEFGYFDSGIPVLNGDNTVCSGIGIIKQEAFQILFSTSNGEDRQGWFVDSRTGGVNRLWESSDNLLIDLPQPIASGSHVLTTQRRQGVVTGWADGNQGSEINSSVVGANDFFRVAYQQAGELYGSFDFYGSLLCSVLTQSERLNLEQWMAARLG